MLQKFLENYPSEEPSLKMMEELLQQSIQLSQCQFGNYVMQYVVSKCYQQSAVIFKDFL